MKNEPTTPLYTFNGDQLTELMNKAHGLGQKIAAGLHANDEAATSEASDGYLDLVRKTLSAPPPPVSASPQQAVPADLHDAIMRLSCKPGRAIQINEAVLQAYREGHRDARHAAAELAASHQAAAGAEGAWAENTGEQPVANEVRVDVEFRNGNIACNVKAAEWAWQVGDEFMERKWVISRWRLAAPSTSQPAREG